MLYRVSATLLPSGYKEEIKPLPEFIESKNSYVRKASEEFTGRRISKEDLMVVKSNVGVDISRCIDFRVFCLQPDVENAMSKVRESLIRAYNRNMEGVEKMKQHFQSVPQ